MDDVDIICIICLEKGKKIFQIDASSVNVPQCTRNAMTI